MRPDHQPTSVRYWEKIVELLKQSGTKCEIVTFQARQNSAFADLDVEADFVGKMAAQAGQVKKEEEKSKSENLQKITFLEALVWMFVWFMIFYVLVVAWSWFLAAGNWDEKVITVFVIFKAPNLGAVNLVSVIDDQEMYKKSYSSTLPRVGYFWIHSHLDFLTKKLA